MREILRWLSGALSDKSITPGMGSYCVQGGEIRATDGRVTAGHPWDGEGEFLVPGSELEKILARLPGEPTLEVLEQSIRIKSGRFRGEVQTLALENWAYPGPEGMNWQELPDDLMDVLKALRPFISDNAIQPWAMTCALIGGWAMATDNVCLAGAPFHAGGKVQELLVPIWAIDFLLGHDEAPTEWAWNDVAIAFRWPNGAWMRSAVIVGKFPETAAAMVRAAWELEPPHAFSPAFREAFERISALSDGLITLYADRMTGSFSQAQVEEEIEVPLPTDCEATHWGGKFLANVLSAATVWDPTSWPRPSPWAGPVLAGYIVGSRKG